MQTPQKQAGSQDEYALCRCRLEVFSSGDARLYVVVHGRYVLMDVVQEIVWIASYFPRHY